MRFAVEVASEAPSEAEARAVTGQALAGLDMGLALHGEPAIAPLGLRDGIWVGIAFGRNRCRRVLICGFTIRDG